MRDVVVERRKEERGRRRRSEEVQQKKQEPRTTMWGKTFIKLISKSQKASRSKGLPPTKTFIRIVTLQ